MARKAIPVLTDVSDLLVSTTAMARHLGITERWLQLLAKDGTLVPLARGKWPLSSTVQAYIAFLKEGAEKKTGTTSMDKLREEKIADIRQARALRDRTAIDLDEALGIFDEQTGIYVSSLNGLPARITSVPRERRRLDDIFDEERLRLCDLLAKARNRLETGREDPEATAEDDAA
ncbi:conserved hypothetical protein [uncultured Pleomorphomonas sp.]|uniref:Uncharacterized protein n=1 Tax=uncultured Pleomorphomonas sp. TaxID=442121 RepID=A0A212LR10_9HYPH|nr:hypothetical protein [uncultured Pleomorphomonas sp.]SCM79952.1 conserved hypothetical protein [uncultured Pleomorphomonas sp.]